MLTRRGFSRLLGAVPLAMSSTLRAQVVTPRPAWSPTGPREGTHVSATSEGLAREHLPFIALPARPRRMRPFDLVVRIGEPNHPQRSDHFIAWIEAAYDGEVLFVTDLSPQVPFPVVRVPVVLRGSGTLSIRAHCTRHGTFVFEQALTPS